MSNSSAVLFSSTASEAIVSQDGRVKRRIPNYETIVLNISDKEIRSDEFDAVNDEFTDIPVLLDPIETEKRQGVSTKRHGLTLFGAVVILTFIWSVYSIFFSSTVSFSQIGDQAAQKFFGLVSSSKDTKQLKKIVDLILYDNDWKNLRVNSLLKHWQALDMESQQQLTNQPWFQHFIYATRQQIKQYQQTNSKRQRILKKEPLLNLGAELGILDSNGNLLSNTASSLKYETLVDEIKQEISQVEIASKKDRQALESEAELNLKLKQQLSAAQQPTKRIQVNDEDIQKLLTEYKHAYENGDMKNMLVLFGAGNSSSGKNSALVSNFENIFENTSKRSINFYDYNWQGIDNSITINSKYNGMLEFEDRKGTQHVVADAQIEASLQNNKLFITSFELLDSKVNVVSPQMDISKNQFADSQEDIPQVPNASELKDLTTQLVTAYETGDIEQFISLFSENAKTNDRSNLTGIKQDYVELFKTTSDRQMLIQNLRWSSESNSVKGIGNLEVTLLSDNGSAVYSMNGKIQIVAQKSNNGVLITHMYHIERVN